MHKPESIQKWDVRKFPGFRDTNWSPARRLDLVLNIKKKRICHLVDFAVLADNETKIEKSENIDKYLDFGGELYNRKNWQIVIVTFGTVPKILEKRLEEQEIW